MKKAQLLGLLAVLALVSVTSVVMADSTYFNAVVASNPECYVRMENWTGDLFGENGVPVTNYGTASLTPMWGENNVPLSRPIPATAGPRPADGFFGMEIGNFCPLLNSIPSTNQQQITLDNGTSTVFNQATETVSLWFKTTNENTDQRMFVNANGANNFQIIFQGGEILLATTTSGTYDSQTIANGVTTGLYLADGEWHNVVAIRNGNYANQAQLFVDGVDVNFAAIAQPTYDSYGTSGGSGKARLGARHSYNVGWGGFIGQLDEVAVWDRALTSTEITNLWNASLTPEPATMSLLVLGGLGLLARRNRK